MSAKDQPRRFVRYQPLNPDLARRLWQDYRDQPNEITRNALMEAYLPVVRYNAQRVCAKLPDQVELEDMISAGNMGLMDAIPNFKPERGNKFETYCAPGSAARSSMSCGNSTGCRAWCGRVPPAATGSAT